MPVVVTVTGAVILGAGTTDALRIDTSTDVMLPDPVPPAGAEGGDSP